MYNDSEHAAKAGDIVKQSQALGTVCDSITMQKRRELCSRANMISTKFEHKTCKHQAFTMGHHFTCKLQWQQLQLGVDMQTACRQLLCVATHSVHVRDFLAKQSACVGM